MKDDEIILGYKEQVEDCAKYCAKRFDLDYDVLVQEGYRGLVIAQRKNKLDKAYSRKIIKSAILNSICANDVYNPMKIPARVKYQIRKVMKDSERFYSMNERQPSIRELEEMTLLNEKTIKRVKEMRKETIPFSKEIHDHHDGSPTLLEDVIEDSKEIHMKKETINRKIREILKYYGDDDRKRKQVRVIYNYYFFGKTMPKIGKEMDLSRERVNQIKKDGLAGIGRKIKEELKSLDLIDSLANSNL